MYRSGKIASLPGELLEGINNRLDEGQSSPQILQWINSEPEALNLLKEDFDGVPISKQNLSEWRNGGYQEWRVSQEFDHYMTAAMNNGYSAKFQSVHLVADFMAAEVAARYAKFLATWDGKATKKVEAQLRVLRGLNRDIALLQKTMGRAHKNITDDYKALQMQRFEAALRQSMQVKPKQPVQDEGKQKSQKPVTEKVKSKKPRRNQARPVKPAKAAKAVKPATPETPEQLPQPPTTETSESLPEHKPKPQAIVSSTINEPAPLPITREPDGLNAVVPAAVV